MLPVDFHLLTVPNARRPIAAEDASETADRIQDWSAEELLDLGG